MSTPKNDRSDSQEPDPRASGSTGDPNPAQEPELLVDTSEGVATLTINRPQRRNALSWDVVTSMREAVESARTDPDVRAVVITGAGDRAFCAGADLTGMRGDSHAELHEGRGEMARLFEDLWDLGKPTVAKVRGYCLAGGFGLALSCDLVVAAHDAVFGTPEINVGLWPYMITVPLRRSMPPKRALDLMMTGRRIDAAEADRFGFLSRVVPADELDATVEELAGTLASASPSVMRLGRDSFYDTFDMSGADALAVLHPMLTVTTGLEDAAEGIAAFVEKREPRWTGR
ncbi:MAG: enoyl-CoA hydratase/isomerase family protein [Microthrixaceae bacterium]